MLAIEKLSESNLQRKIKNYLRLVHVSICFVKYLEKLKLSTKGDPTPKLSLKFEWIRENSAFTCLCNKALIKYYI